MARNLFWFAFSKTFRTQLKPFHKYSDIYHKKQSLLLTQNQMNGTFIAHHKKCLLNGFALIISIFGSNYLYKWYTNSEEFYMNVKCNQLIQLWPHLRSAQMWTKDKDDDREDNRLMASKRFNFIADVTEKVSSALVFIDVVGRHPFFKEINISLSNGSGFIVDSSGLILTNAHVVANASVVSIKLFDGRVVTGRVEYVDQRLDLATVRIEGRHDLPFITLGDSQKSRTGEWVIAMGSPFSLSNTITVGVISSLKRKSQELGLRVNEIDYIQTDAAVNVGNSGGPLVNLDGEAIGINTMKVTAGISFAIPSHYAKEFLERANRFKHKTPKDKSEEKSAKRNRYIGVTMLTLTPDLIQELHSRDKDFPQLNYGILVWKVVMGSPAHLEGLQPGDIITVINGQTASSVSDVYKALEVDQSLSITVRRKERDIDLVVRPQVVD